MHVVLDTNVLISAVLWKGKTRQIIFLIEQDKITPCFSPETLEELQGVLSRSKFKKELISANLTIETISKCLLSKSKIFKLPRWKTKVVKVDPSDDKFFLLAKVAKVRYLVSGDKHLLKLKKIGNTKIVSVSEFLKLLT